MMERMDLEYVPINLINSNPLNPRKDYTKNTEDLQEVIRDKGWETAITCYKKNNRYIILSGHRRWYAGKQLGETHLPVFVVTAPQSELEELERLSSSQSGKDDWSVYEWARYIFDLWSNNTENWTIREIAIKVKKSETTVADSIKVFRYYNHSEIEKQLEEGHLKITLLARIIDWIEKLKKYHSDIVNEIGEDIIRINMIYKAERKGISSGQLRSDRFLEYAPKDVLKIFLRKSKMKYSEMYTLMEEEKPEYYDSRVSRISKTLEKRKREISRIELVNQKEIEEMSILLETLSIEIRLKKEELSDFINM